MLYKEKIPVLGKIGQERGLGFRNLVVCFLLKNESKPLQK